MHRSKPLPRLPNVNETPEQTDQIIRFNDVYWAARPLLHKIDFQLNEGYRTGGVVGYAPATDEVYRLMAEYQSGSTVQLLDFLAFQRRIRGRLPDLRGAIIW